MGESKPQLAAGSHPYYLGAEPFVSATYAAQPCGCQIVGAGVIPSPLDIKRCPAHEAAPQMLGALRAEERWLESLTPSHIEGASAAVKIGVKNRLIAIRAAIKAATGGKHA